MKTSRSSRKMERLGDDTKGVQSIMDLMQLRTIEPLASKLVGDHRDDETMESIDKYADKNGDLKNPFGFWGKEDWGSSFYQSPFMVELGDDTFMNVSCSEQWYVWRKAWYFGDYDSMYKLSEQGLSPVEYKWFGSKIRGFDRSDWAGVRDDYMMEALLLKFGGSIELARRLEDTGDAVLVETSPVDEYWGVGLSKIDLMGQTDDRWKNMMEWNGDNRLGFLLMTLRKELPGLIREHNIEDSMR